MSQKHIEFFLSLLCSNHPPTWDCRQSIWPPIAPYRRGGGLPCRRVISHVTAFWFSGCSFFSPKTPRMTFFYLAITKLEWIKLPRVSNIACCVWCQSICEMSVGDTANCTILAVFTCCLFWGYELPPPLTRRNTPIWVWCYLPQVFFSISPHASSPAPQWWASCVCSMYAHGVAPDRPRRKVAISHKGIILLVVCHTHQSYRKYQFQISQRLAPFKNLQFLPSNYGFCSAGIKKSHPNRTATRVVRVGIALLRYFVVKSHDIRAVLDWAPQRIPRHVFAKIRAIACRCAWVCIVAFYTTTLPQPHARANFFAFILLNIVLQLCQYGVQQTTALDPTTEKEEGPRAKRRLKKRGSLLSGPTLTAPILRWMRFVWFYVSTLSRGSHNVRNSQEIFECLSPFAFFPRKKVLIWIYSAINRLFSNCLGSIPSGISVVIFSGHATVEGFWCLVHGNMQKFKVWVQVVSRLLGGGLILPGKAPWNVFETDWRKLGQRS